mmetsp:Transcript_34661/g.33853  ORF Transcript_34661/g.33853 Transcript_34661/m.33853 type:complete len:94 (+) Transcript_34661:268-549(+)
MALSTIAGIGGGGVVIPFCMTFFGFPMKKAIAISGFSIFTCSITRFIYNVDQKHPKKSSVVIDYGLSTIMLPLVLVGSLNGVVVNLMFPSLIL